MRIVALEEHFTVPRIVAGISPAAIAARGFPGPDFPWAQTIKRAELADLVQGQQGIDIATAYNDAIAESCARHPSRDRGFAHLPLHSPDVAPSSDSSMPQNARIQVPDSGPGAMAQAAVTPPSTISPAPFM